MIYRSPLVLGLCFLALVMAGLSFIVAAKAEDPFLEIASAHFRVRFTMEAEREQAGHILRRAEAYYLRVANDIGYSRYDDVWTWERRVSIILYPDQYAYARFTGAPEWSKGHASRDARIFRDRAIVSYNGQDNFLDEVLPHEIAHLMFWDYLGTRRSVLTWFEEGVAQLEEKDKAERVLSVMAGVVRQKLFIPLPVLQTMTVAGEKDNLKVSLFYAQSLSIVVFLIQKYGVDAFHRLCREWRDGASFEEALVRAYPFSLNSISDLENKWLKFLSE
jgi:hypothetical protein